MKRFLRNLGIQRKMQAMNLLICGAVLLVAISALFTFQVLNFRANFQRETATFAAVIANNSTAAMAFKDEQWAAEVVSSLHAKPTVIAASLVTPDGNTFSHYGLPETPRTLNQFPPPGQSRFVSGQLLNTEPVRVKGEQVGTLYLRSDYQETFLKLLRFYGLLVAGVIVVSAGLGALLSTRLGRTISDPILSLAHTALIVGEQKDYSVRAAVEERGDELGRLTQSFNDMLSRIQSQDAALSLSQQKMEALIHSIDGIVWERALDTFQFTFVSRQCEAMLGYPLQAWLSEPNFWANKLHPQDAKAIETAHALAAKGQPYSFEYRMVAADGRTVWIRESGTALVENGKPAVLRGILLDITRQKQDAEQLDKLNRRLMETSRQAGMADVATGVLHNVGNVLNSVSVAATVVGERLRHSKLPNLRKAAAMLRGQNGHLVEFLTTDPKGKVLPEYISTVTDQLAEEQTKLAGKMETLAQHVEHIKEIVAMQQSYAKVSGAYEHLSPVELIEDALRINATAFDRHAIELVRDFAPKLPSVVVDRHKVLQILINLLRNAKHAMEENTAPKRMVIRISQSSPDMVQVSVRDNGMGIPAENLSRIFNHGFTTKKDGHGFGLHSGANAAKEMGGSLTAASAGPGQGAEFVLELPTTTHARQEQRSKA